jgi:Holliday junction DNA helicase RuvA
MIGRLKGTLAAKHPPELLVDVNGVGYEVSAPMSTFYDLPQTGSPVTLLTHLVVREDSQTLYGFLREGDRALFRSLIKVSGVGARLALAILSGMDAAEFSRSVHERDAAALSRLPGIGKKTAERLIVEMSGRLEAPEVAGMETGDSSRPASDATEAIGALVALGYKHAEAERMVGGVAEPGMASEEIIRLALKRRGRAK